MMKNKDCYSKSCAYLFYRYYSEGGIVAAKIRLGCKDKHLIRNRINRFLLGINYNFCKDKRVEYGERRYWQEAIA